MEPTKKNSNSKNINKRKSEINVSDLEDEN